MKPITTVFLDANVLYGARLRSLLLFLALEEAFDARWSNRVHDEWIDNLRKNRPDLKENALQRVREEMDTAVLNCLVTVYEDLIDSVDLPDPNDRHVVAAAIATQADVILTFNLSDFPSTSLARHRLIAMHPDEFLVDLLENKPIRCLKGLRLDFHHYREPKLSFPIYVDSFRKIGMPRFAAHLETLSASIVH